ALVAALRAEGLGVLVDDGRVEEFTGITQTVVAALARSKALLAHYSTRYPARPARQWELTAAFLAAERDGDPWRRVLCLNPEREVGHLAPAELAGARFSAYPADPAALPQLARQLRASLESITGPLGDAVPLRPPQPADRAVRPRRFVGRFRELWQLHTTLRSADDSASRPDGGGPVAVISGPPGIGKTTLAEHYALLFAGAYPGGIVRIGPLGGGRRARADEALS